MLMDNNAALLTRDFPFWHPIPRPPQQSLTQTASAAADIPPPPPWTADEPTAAVWAALQASSSSAAVLPFLTQGGVALPHVVPLAPAGTANPVHVDSWVMPHTKLPRPRVIHLSLRRARKALTCNRTHPKSSNSSNQAMSSGQKEAQIKACITTTQLAMHGWKTSSQPDPVTKPQQRQPATSRWEPKDLSPQRR